MIQWKGKITASGNSLCKGAQPYARGQECGPWRKCANVSWVVSCCANLILATLASRRVSNLDYVSLKILFLISTLKWLLHWSTFCFYYSCYILSINYCQKSQPVFLLCSQVSGGDFQLSISVSSYLPHVFITLYRVYCLVMTFKPTF